MIPTVFLDVILGLNRSFISMAAAGRTVLVLIMLAVLPMVCALTALPWRWSSIAEGVIADFRAPEYLRIGFAPLYNTYAEVESSVNRLATIMQEKRYLKAEFQQRSKVT